MIELVRELLFNMNIMNNFYIVKYVGYFIYKEN